MRITTYFAPDRIQMRGWRTIHFWLSGKPLSLQGMKRIRLLDNQSLQNRQNQPQKSLNEAHQRQSLANELPAELAEKDFVGKLASLIETEIERRVAEQTSDVQKTNRKKSTLARTRKKQKKPNETKQRKHRDQNRSQKSSLPPKNHQITKRNQPRCT